MYFGRKMEHSVWPLRVRGDNLSGAPSPAPGGPAVPAAVPFAVRQALFAAAQRGQDLSALAARFGLPLRTARRLLQQFRQAGQACPAAYRRGPQPPRAADLLPEARALR